MDPVRTVCPLLMEWLIGHIHLEFDVCPITPNGQVHF